MPGSLAQADATIAGDSRRLPKGAILVIMFEFFERFGFYSMLSLLALFLTASRATDGFGWDAASALRVLGIYTGLMYALPMVGGFVADRVIGHRRAVGAGAALMLTGYVLLFALGTVPTLLGSSVAAGFASIAAPLGDWTAPAGLSPELARAYELVTFCFWAALLCLVLGNALFKATMVIVLGDSFAPADPRRDRAYAYYYMGINFGGLIAGVVAGSVAKSYGWHAAFGTSAIGIGIGLTCFAVLGRRLLGPPRPRSEDPEIAEQDVHLPTRLFLLGVFALLLCVYAIGAFQIYGTYSLFIEHYVDRRLLDFVIPTQWYTSVHSIGLIAAAPVLAWVWTRLARSDREPDIIGKYAVALLLGSLGILLVAWQASLANPSWWIVAVAILIQAAGEVAAWVSTYGLVYRLAPRRIVAAVMGGFYAITLGLGGYAAGWLGQFASDLGNAAYFTYLGLATLVAASVALLLRPKLLAIAVASGTSLSRSGT